MDLCGHCNDTYGALLPAILPGDRLECEWMLVHRRDATLKSNPDVEIEVVEPNSAREDELRAACSELARHEYYRTCDAHLEGPLVYAHLDGEVVGTAGWFIARRVSSFSQHPYRRTPASPRRGDQHDPLHPTTAAGPRAGWACHLLRHGGHDSSVRTSRFCTARLPMGLVPPSLR